MESFPLSEKALRARPQAINYLMTMGLSKDIISLAAGLVDWETLPADDLADVMAEFVRERGRAALQYGASEGFAPLREKVLERLARQEGGLPEGVTIDRVRLSTGSQQMLYLLTEALVDAGDIVIVAAPTYFVYLGVLDSAGATAVSVEADGEGMRVDALCDVLSRLEREGLGHRVKIVYVTTYFDNPSGASLSAERRRTLLAALDAHASMRPLIVEDAAYRELRFSGPDLPSLWGLDKGRRTAYVGTFSKPFAPGLRTGYAILPEEIAEKVLLLKGSHDFGSASFCQHLIDFAIERGIYDTQVERLRARYAAKRDLLCDCLEREMGGAATWQKPSGGLYVWADFGGIDTRMGGEFFNRALREEKVLYVPGDICYGGSGAAPRSKMRICFGPTSESDIEEGVARLARAVSRHAAGVSGG